MSKKKKKATKAKVSVKNTNASEEVLTVVPKQEKKEDKKQLKKLKAAKKQAKADKPKRNHGKEVLSELKKVNWPKFSKALKQTGAVLVVVGLFMLAILGIDSLVAWILSLLTNI